MMVEAMVKWMELRAKKTDGDDAQLRRLVHGEETPDFIPEIIYSYSPMVFDMEDVSRFNRSSDMKSTTVRFHDGDYCVMDITYEEFRNLWMQLRGDNIHSTVSDAQEKAAREQWRSSSEGSIGSDFNIDRD